MVNKIKVLIGDDSVEYGIACASTLRGLGMYAVTRPKDGGVLFETIKNDMPDVIVVDAILPHMDAIELIKKVQSLGGKSPEFIITSSYDNPFIEKQVMQSGAAYFMLKPFVWIEISLHRQAADFYKLNDNRQTWNRLL